MPLGEDRPVMALDDPAAQGKPDSRPRVRAASMKSLEHAEDSLAVARLEADPVVSHGDLDRVSPSFRVDAHLWGDVRTPELQGVGDQVLQELAHLQRVGPEAPEM